MSRVAAGAIVQEDLSEADIIIAVKEIPIHLLQVGKAYLFFSHTIKGQAYNMPLLRQLMKLKCQLIDYERIADAHNRRLIAFGKYAGLAGMVDTLAALGQRLDWEGIDTPFSDLQQTYTYDDLTAVQKAVRSVGRRIAANSKVARCPHEPPAEVMVPDSVDDDSSQQSSATLLRIRYPLGQGAPLQSTLGFPPVSIPGISPIVSRLRIG